jgi:type IV secretion system protein TrbL
MLRRVLLILVLAFVSAYAATTSPTFAQSEPAPDATPGAYQLLGPQLNALSAVSPGQCNLSLQNPSQPSVFSPIVNTLTALTGPLDQFANTAYGLGRTLFLILVPLELGWFFIQLAIRHRDVTELFTHAGFKVLNVMFFFGLLNFVGQHTNVIHQIENGWISAGAQVTQYSATSSMASSGVGLAPNGTPVGDTDLFADTMPGRIIGAGFCNAFNITLSPMKALGVSAAQVASSGDIGQMITNGVKTAVLGAQLLFSPIFDVLFIIQFCVAVLVMVTYGVIALQMIITLIERSIVTGVGIILLGFSATRWTMDWAQGYWRYVVHVGIKLFTITIIAGIGSDWLSSVIASQVTATVNNATPIAAIPSLLLEIFAALLLLGMVLALPNMVATYLSGTPAMGTGTLAAGVALPVMAGMALVNIAAGLPVLTAAMKGGQAGFNGAGDAAGQTIGGRQMGASASAAEGAPGVTLLPPLPAGESGPPRVGQSVGASGGRASQGAGSGAQRGSRSVPPPTKSSGGTAGAAPQTAAQPETEEAVGAGASAGGGSSSASGGGTNFEEMMDRLTQGQMQSAESLALTAQHIEKIAQGINGPKRSVRDIVKQAVDDAREIKSHLLRDHAAGGSVNIRMDHHHV